MDLADIRKRLNNSRNENLRLFKERFPDFTCNELDLIDYSKTLCNLRNFHVNKTKSYSDRHKGTWQFYNDGIRTLTHVAIRHICQCSDSGELKLLRDILATLIGKIVFYKKFLFFKSDYRKIENWEDRIDLAEAIIYTVAKYRYQEYDIDWLVGDIHIVCEEFFYDSKTMHYRLSQGDRILKVKQN